MSLAREAPFGTPARPARQRVGLTLADGVRAAAAARPDRLAIVIDGDRVTYAQLVDRIGRVSAGAQQDLGLRVGDRIALCLPNCLPFLELVCGFSAVGVPAATLPPMASPGEIRTIVEDCEPRVVVCHASNEEQVRVGSAHVAERFLVIGREGPDSYEAWLANARPLSDPAPVDENSIFSIPYTSGATGKPKGILLSHRSRILTAYAAAAEYSALGPDTRMLVSTPVFHGAGFLNLLAPCWFGGQAVILSRFTIDRLLALVQEHRITKAHLVPAHFAAYFGLPEAERRRWDVSSLRCIVSGTAPLAQPVKERIVEAFGPDVLHERYGSTEASIVSNLRPEDQLRKQACVGLPFASVEVEIRDADGRVLPAGETGELWSRSPLMFSGYWRRPDAERTALRDGWVSAGDLARRDEEGYVYLVDRKDDMIISGGENVYPREIEEVLLRHPAVEEAAVVGLSHDYWGEAVSAVVHLRSGMNASGEELRAFCAETLARWKVPKTVHFGGPLPRNSMGKVLRRLVKDRLGGIAAPNRDASLRHSANGDNQ
jgi:acyl-CoA synthetase (AMP-forming)/AMP-acid ligase II